jgi:sugar transferase (PEP-CTERM/EpsH1 system associated)
MNENRIPLVAHVMYRFNVGGLENGVVNLINHMPEDAYRHVVVSLTDVTDFRNRIRRKDVEFISLNKPPGHALKIYPRLFRLFRSLRPAIVHSRNLAALEVSAPAWAAQVPVRIHGEHGRDVEDLDGSSVKYQWARRLYRPFVTHYVALSRDLEQYLVRRVGVPSSRVAQLYNGVDVARFCPPTHTRAPVPGCPFGSVDHFLVGTVGRMQPVKDQTNLARAFVDALRAAPALRARLRLVMVGDGPLRDKAQAILGAAGMAELAWLPGERDDIPDILRGLDCFVLPSLAEGISNTILEAMACGLPVVATDVGGNRELLEPGVTGELVPAANPAALAEAILGYAADPLRARQAGRAGRELVERCFSMDSMTRAYRNLYDRLLCGRGEPVRAAGAGR